MKIRRIISLTVFLAFIVMALSGIMLFLSPKGRVAYWAGWTFLGLDKDQWVAIHTTFMVLFLATGIWHIVLNWRPIVGYLKDRSKKLTVINRESVVAMVLTGLFLLGPIAGFPPFQQFLDAGEDIKDYWESVRGSPPWGHAEESSLELFCRRIGDYSRWQEGPLMVDCAEAQMALEAAGIEVEGSDQRIIDMAEANGMTPQEIADVILTVARPATPQEIASGLAGSRGRGLRQAPGSGEGSAVGAGSGAGSGAGAGRGTAGTGSGRGTGAGAGSGAGRGVEVRPEAPAQEGVEEHEEAAVRFPRPGSGLGRMTLRGYAREYGFDLDELLGILSGKGMTIDPDARFQALAGSMGLKPAAIIDSLNAGE